MTILLVGGGSGGHITPLLAVAHSLAKKLPQARLDFVIEKGSKFVALPRQSQDIKKVHSIRAGKFRRYHGESFLQHVLDIKTLLKNLRDLVFFVMGTIQALWLVARLRPSVVFIKGGFVGVPIGLACALFRVPFITHDSDALPGLANRIIGRWAKLHLVGMPESFYNYPKETTHYVGVPVNQVYQKVTSEKKRQYKKQLGIPVNSQIICITGGSLGAQRLNTGLVPIVSKLIKERQDLYVVHQTGAHERLYRANDRIKESQFIDDLYLYTGASDVVITRAGATTIAELALQQKAAVLVPNPNLTGGHQLKNAQELASTGAVEIITENSLKHQSEAIEKIENLLQSKSDRQKLAQKLHSLAKTNATGEICDYIIKTIRKK